MFARILLPVLLSFHLSEGIIHKICGPDEFPCNNGGCIQKYRWCDSTEDCEDDSDERYCAKRTKFLDNPNRCKDGFFLCLDGPCIPIVGRCDGFRSCRDNSDEENCTRHVSTDPIPVSRDAASRLSTDVSATSRVTTHASTTYAHILEPESPVKSQDFNLENHDIQSDSVSAAVFPQRAKEVDIFKGFVELNAHFFQHEKESAESWLLSRRDAEYGWGDETARAMITLHLSDPGVFEKESDDSMLMSKQLHLKLSIALTRNQTKPIPLSELGSYINALHATCDDPKNFHGHDLVEILRQRTNVAQDSGKFVNPSVYLTLCISNITTYQDVRKIQEMSYGANKLDRIDLQALLTLAASCVTRIPAYTSSRLEGQIATRMLHRVTELGLPENVYELALTIQALNEAKVNQDLWNRTDALNHLSKYQQNGSFGDVLATYYALPVLSGKSIVSLANHCNKETEKGMVSVEVLMNGKEQKDFVSYSLDFGNPVEVSQTLRIKVKKSTNLLDLMRIAAATNPIYRFKYELSRGKPFVYSIGDTVNDAEQGLYWILHISRRNSSGLEHSEQYTGDIRSYYPAASDHIVYWFRNLY